MKRKNNFKKILTLIKILNIYFMEKKTNNANSNSKKIMAKLITPLVTDKKGIYKFKTEVLEYEKALQIAKNIK